MPRRQVIVTVLQTVLLITCTLITTHHLKSSAVEKFSTIELYKNYTDATVLAAEALAAKRAQQEAGSNQTLATLDAAANDTLVDIAGPRLDSVNTTAAGNNNGTAPDGDKSEEESFYWQTLPKSIFLNAIIALLNHYWQIGLERAFPARPRPASSLTTTTKTTTPTSPVRSVKGQAAAAAAADDDDGDSREEEVVQKWIAQGKIRRASLSWGNTFVKWLLDIVVGGLWISVVCCLGQRLLDAKRDTGVLHGFVGQVIRTWAFSCADWRPLTSLVALSIVPAHKRIVVVAGLDLAIWTFLGLFANLLIPWVATTVFAQDMLGNMTEAVRNSTTPSLRDEL